MMRKALPILGYFLAAAFVIVGTLLLIAYGNGYSYEIKTGKLLHRGLIIVSTTPSGAKITLGKKLLSQKTPYRGTMIAGWYDFTLEKEGYRTWHHLLESIPSQANLIQYVVLLPQHIAATALGTYPSITQTIVSPDHRRVAFQVEGEQGGGIWSLDTASRQQTRIYTPPPATPDVPAATTQALAWSKDNSHLLLRSQVGSTISLLVVSSNGTEQPIDITSTLKVDATTLTFDPNDWHILYWQSGDGLRRIDLRGQTVSAILVEHLAAFTFAGDQILYVDSQGPPALWSLDKGGHKQLLVKTLPPSQSYDLSFSHYFGAPELALAAKDSHVVMYYSNIFDRVVKKTRLHLSAQQVIFSENGRFILAYDDANAGTYDVERMKVANLPTTEGAISNIGWFDDYHLVYTYAGKVVLSEFDGNYPVAITKVSTSLPPYGTPDGKFVITTGTTSANVSQLKAVTIRK